MITADTAGKAAGALSSPVLDRTAPTAHGGSDGPGAMRGAGGSQRAPNALPRTDQADRPRPPVPPLGDSGRSKTSVAVVGAGPGGLTTAMMLAAAGCAVTVYEAQPVVGGRTRRIEVGPYRFDCGPTFFMMPYVLEEIFAASGRRLADYADLIRLDPMYRLLLGRPEGEPLRIDATQDLERMAAQLSAIEPADGPAFLRFIRDNRRKLELMTPILRRPIRSLFDLMTVDAVKVAPTLKPWQSLYGLLKGYFRNDQIRLALSFQSKYLGMSPFECPSLFSILPFIEYEYGIWHPRGGCNALTAAMAAVVGELGGTIRCGSPVERLEFEGSRCVGLTVGGQTLRHDHVVVNADATWAMRHLIPESLRRSVGAWDDATIERKRYSCSTFMMYLGVDGAIDLPHHTIYTSASYRENLADIAQRGRLSVDPSTYLCNPSRLDPSLAPPGHSALYVLVPTPNAQAAIDWESAAPKLREDAFAQLESVFGLTDLRRRVRAEKLVTPADWRSERITHGATFNLAHGLGQMLHRRPHHKLEGFDRLWLVGGGTHPGSGLPVIFLSSEITTGLICAEAGLPNPLAASR
jgi:phytoene desaturase